MPILTILELDLVLDCGYSETLNKRMRAARKTIFRDFRNPL